MYILLSDITYQYVYIYIYIYMIVLYIHRYEIYLEATWHDDTHPSIAQARQLSGPFTSGALSACFVGARALLGPGPGHQRPCWEFGMEIMES